MKWVLISFSFVWMKETEVLWNRERGQKDACDSVRRERKREERRQNREERRREEKAKERREETDKRETDKMFSSN